MFGYYLLTKIIKPESQLILSGLMIYYTIIYIPCISILSAVLL